jgi:hypothetical protein
MKVIINVVLAIQLTDNIWHRQMIQQSNIRHHYNIDQH